MFSIKSINLYMKAIVKLTKTIKINIYIKKNFCDSNNRQKEIFFALRNSIITKKLKL